MTDTLPSPTMSSMRGRAVLKRNGSSRGSMIAASTLSFFKPGVVSPHTVVEGDSDEDPEDSLFYGTVYPLSYDRELATFDVLDHFFLHAHVGSTTFTKFKNEPLDVLDLGCGAGTWIIDTAKSWVLTHFVGFDVNMELHPNPTVLQPPGLQERIRWVQGDFLQRLPFPVESFDFVRCSKIGLAVPENKWQALLSDISRILRPGGSLEIIEENLIFPMPSLRPLKPTPEEERARAATTAEQSQIDSHNSEASSYSQGDYDDPSGYLQENDSSLPHLATDRSYRNDEPAPESGRDELDRSERDPRDHRKLKRAWDAMLAAREINQRPLSILNLYLSTSFAKYSAFATGRGMVVPLPGPSAATMPEPDPDDPPASPVLSTLSRTRTNGDIVTDNQSLHLLRSLATVMACRESMLPHFRQLELMEQEEEDDAPPVSGGNRTSMSGIGSERKKPRRRQRRAHARDDFNALCANYERDMLDRIAMGACLTTKLGWTPPRQLVVPGPLRESKDEAARWRDDIRMWRKHEQSGTFSADLDENISRTLNIWTATKAEADDPPTSTLPRFLV